MDIYDKILKYHWLSIGSGFLGMAGLCITSLFFVRWKMGTTMMSLFGTQNLKKIKNNTKITRKEHTNEKTTRLSELQNARNALDNPTVFVCKHRSEGNEH